MELLGGVGAARQGREVGGCLVKLQAVLVELAVPEAHRARFEQPALLRVGHPAHVVRKRLGRRILQAARVSRKAELKAGACEVLDSLQALAQVVPEAVGQAVLAELELLLGRVVALPDVEPLRPGVPVEANRRVCRVLEGERLALELPPLLHALLARPVDDHVRLAVELAAKVEAARLARQAQLQVEVFGRGVLHAAVGTRLVCAQLPRVVVHELVVCRVVARPNAKVLLLREEVQALVQVTRQLQDLKRRVVEPLLGAAGEVARAVVDEAQRPDVLHAEALTLLAQVHHICVRSARARVSGVGECARRLCCAMGAETVLCDGRGALFSYSLTFSP